MNFIDSFKYKDTSKSDYLLIIPPFNDISLVPLGAGYIVNHLREHGFISSVFDLNVKLHNTKKYSCFWKGKLPPGYDLFENVKELLIDYFNDELEEFIKFIAKQPQKIITFSGL